MSVGVSLFVYVPVYVFGADDVLTIVGVVLLVFVVVVVVVFVFVLVLVCVCVELH